MPRTENLLRPPAWAEPFGTWYRHWAVAVVLGLATMAVFVSILRDSGPIVILLVLVLVPGTALNAWLGHQGRQIARGDASVLQARFLDDRLELSGLASPMARRRWVEFGPGVLTLGRVGATKQGAVLYSLAQDDAEVRFLHDSDVTADRLSRLAELARDHGVRVVVQG